MPNIEKSKPSALAQYSSGFDIQEMQQEAEKLPSGGSTYWKPVEGKNTIRLVPAPSGKRAFMTWHKHHFSVGNDRKSVICAKYQYKQPCPVCEMGMKMRSSGSKVDIQRARAYEPSSSVYMNIVDMKNPEKGVQLWTASPGVFKNIMDAIDTAGVKNVADPVNGYNITFKRTGSKMDTRYTGFSVARESSELPAWEELLPTQTDLENAESPPTDEEQDDAVDGEYEAKGGGSFKKKNSSGTGGSRRERDVTPRGGSGGSDDGADEEEGDVTY